MNTLTRSNTVMRAYLSAILIVSLSALSVCAGEKPGMVSTELDSMAREFLAAAKTYRSTLGPGTAARSADSALGKPPYAAWMGHLDSIVDTAHAIARNVTMAAGPVKAMLQRLAQGDRSVEISALAYWQNEVYDVAQPLKRLLSQLKREENGVNGPDGYHIACCPPLFLDSAPALLPISRTADSIEKGLRNRIDLGEINAEIQKDENTIGRFRMKLIDGFPAYPWEYWGNLTGDRFEPARWQLIWAHPTFGFTLAGPGSDLAPPDIRLNNWSPAILLEVAGINCYFFNRWFNYAGASVVVWKSIGEGGGWFGLNAHLANWVTVGISLLDGDWDFDPRLMVGWTTASSRILEVFK